MNWGKVVLGFGGIGLVGFGLGWVGVGIHPFVLFVACTLAGGGLGLLVFQWAEDY